MKLIIFTTLIVLWIAISHAASESKCKLITSENNGLGEYSCVQTTLDDIYAIPDEAEWIRFIVSKLQHIPERAFSRFSLRGLFFHTCKIGHIDAKAFEGLELMEYLTFYATNIHVVKASWFKNLFSLTHLLLGRNDLVYIEPNVFPLLANVEVMNIWDNNLNCLPRQVLAPMNNLKHFQIGRNPWLCSCYTELVTWLTNKSISYGSTDSRECMLEGDIPFEASRMPENQKFEKISVSQNGYIGISPARDILCVGNDISSLSEIPDNVRSITFMRSNIPKLPRLAFLRFGNSLETLAFRNCSVREIHPEAFAGLTRLQTLLLFTNNFSTVRGEWFRDLRRLEYLGLDENGIDHIEPSVFPLLNKLKHWSLSYNNIQCIPASEMNSLQKLEDMIITNNPWNCSCQENLRKWLHEKRIRYIVSRGPCVDGHVQMTDDLFEQSFENPEAEEVDGEIKTGLSDAEVIQKSNLQDQVDEELHIESSGDQGSVITRANADQNRNIEIGELEYYRLQVEQQQQYSAQLTKGTNAAADTINNSSRHVNLSSHVRAAKDRQTQNWSMKQFPAGLKKSYVIVRGTIWDALSISSDATAIKFENSDIPQVISVVLSRFGSSLRVIEFHNCSIQDIEVQAFGWLVNLEEIILSDNQLQVVKSAWFNGIPNLRRLSLTGNSISKIDDGVFRVLTNLEHLDISNNKLNCFKINGLSYLTKLKTIKIGGNPWSCLCNKKLQEWLYEHKIRYEKDSFDDKSDLDCRKEYRSFKMTNNQDTNSISEKNSLNEKEMEELADIDDIDESPALKNNEEFTTTTEYTGIREIVDNKADPEITVTINQENVPQTTTVKPESFNKKCTFHDFNGSTESRWWCRGGDISVLDEIPSSAERIDIINSFIPTIPANAFIRFHNLTRLLFYSSSIRDIDSSAFAKLTKLKWLIFFNNSISTIRSSWFRDLTNLKLLGLVRNGITEINSGVFDYLPDLRRLSIQDNGLRCIYTKSLASSKNLQKVTMQGNPWKWRCREELTQYFDARNISYIKSETYDGQRMIADILPDESFE